MSLGSALGIATGGTSLLGLAGGFASSAVDLYGMKRASDEASFQRDWESRMRSTQYQTAVADMKAAGLNPMLAFEQGGAGVPAGATADVPGMRNPVASALQIAQGKKQLDVMDSQVNLNNAVRDLNKRTKSLRDAEQPKADLAAKLYKAANQGLDKAVGTAKEVYDYAAETFGYGSKPGNRLRMSDDSKSRKVPRNPEWLKKVKPW